MSARSAMGAAARGLGALLALAGCAGYPEAAVLSSIDAPDAYRLDNLAMNPGNGDETFVFLALSGGGTRAAAFSYGAMRALSRARLADGESVLMDEVDVISSVSGGSFASAYYATHGRAEFLASFEEEVLQRRIETALTLRLLAPWSWWKLGSWWYGRSDLAAEYYERLFDGKRYADLPRVRPLVLLNATDLSMGARFGFVQDHFDRLCADLGSVSVARGVAASSAFPVAFTPLSFRNRPDEACGYDTPTWVDNGLADLELNAARFDRARTARSYQDPQREVIHLSDGGLADNIGLRGPLEGLLHVGAPLSILRRLNDGKIDRVVFIAVDAKPRGEASIDRSAHPPGILTVLNRAATTPMENYSTDTVELARSFIARWNLEQAAAPGEGPQVAFYAIHVRFELERDAAVREALQAIPTQLQLPEEQVALLVRKGGTLLEQSVQYRCLLEAIGAPGSAPPVPAEDRVLCPER